MQTRYKARNRARMKAIALVFAALLFMMAGNCQSLQAAEAEKVKIGKTLDFGTQGASYRSSDEAIAYVNAEGRVTGKKVGVATITIKKAGKTSQKKVSVIANAKKPSMKLCADEITVEDAVVELSTPESSEPKPSEAPSATDAPDTTNATDATDTAATAAPEENAGSDGATDAPEDKKPEEEGKPEEESKKTYSVKVTVKNNGKNTAKKVVLEGYVFENKITFDFGSLKAGQEKTVVQKGVTKKEDSEFAPSKLYVYSGDMLSSYDYGKDAMAYDYATKDTKAPVISGFIGENSYNEDIPYQTVYAGEDYDYFKYVSAKDDRDSKVELTVDTSKVNFKKKGTYTITYTAKDKAGNASEATAKISVRTNDATDKMAAKVLKGIIKESWSDKKKAIAIYNYTRGHIAYLGFSDKSSWEKGAVTGLQKGRGDCFIYYSLSRLLLTRAGIPNLKVTRVKGSGQHWWNMAYVEGGFYHFDTCPRRQGGRFCLVTDSQLKSYSKNHGNSHIWAYDKKPKSATKVLSSIY